LIVADANLLAYLLIEGEKTPRVQQVWERDPQWRLPPLWRHELLNILASYGKYGGATREEMLAVYRRADSLYTPHEHPVQLADALEIAIELQLSAYDAQYVSLARELDVQLVTEDGKLRKAVPGRTQSVEEFLRQK